MLHQERERTTEVNTLPETEMASTSETTSQTYGDRRDVLARWTQAVYLVLGVVEALIAIRFLLRLLGANPSAAFTTFMYDLTDPLVAPFYGVFGTPSVSGSVLEPHSLIAMAVYALVAWLIVRLIWLIFDDDGRVSTSSRRVHHQHSDHVYR